jgi:carbon-monoxide dehydrogenase small subunit
MKISINVNGRNHRFEADPGAPLADTLRLLGYLEVKKACGTGNCGLCTVLLDDVPVPSCSVITGKAAGHSVTTVRGLGKDASILAACIVGEGVDQCGYCSPGFAVMAIAMRREYQRMGRLPNDEEIKHYLAGNLCRCSGYEGHLRALRRYLGASHE